RRDASTDRLGRSIGEIECGGLASLLHCLPMAVPAFHGNRMDVPRRLRSCGLHGASSREIESSSCGSANHFASDGVDWNWSRGDFAREPYFPLPGGAHGVNYLLGHAIRNSAQQISRGVPTASEALKERTRLKRDTPYRAPWLVAFAVGIACASFGR